MKIEELYSKLAEHKPEGVVKEGKEWSKGVLKACVIGRPQVSVIYVKP